MLHINSIVLRILFTEVPFINIRIENNDTELEVKAGRNVFYMRASYQSYPDANISWYKDAELIDAGYIHYRIRYSKV